METTHQLYPKNSSDMSEVKSDSVDLVITSPPYPMIKMWDSLFSSLNKNVAIALKQENGKLAFDLMHKELDKVWKEVVRVIKPSGIICVNIGDATRKIGNIFQLYPNHVRIINFFLNNDFIEFPCILWRKPTNSPNKFLGSGMLPPNAYVTLEHEYILIFRKGTSMRSIAPKSENRYNSVFFWEERNKWFSDVWELKGIKQHIGSEETRCRSVAYPFELAYRLINMYSVQGDVILDPFLGTGTTTIAAISSCRNSIGIEIEENFKPIVISGIQTAAPLANDKSTERLQHHFAFIHDYTQIKGSPKHYNQIMGSPVVTSQETELELLGVDNVIEKTENAFQATYFRFSNFPTEISA